MLCLHPLHYLPPSKRVLPARTQTRQSSWQRSGGRRSLPPTPKAHTCDEPSVKRPAQHCIPPNTTCIPQVSPAVTTACHDLPPWLRLCTRLPSSTHFLSQNSPCKVCRGIGFYATLHAAMESHTRKQCDELYPTPSLTSCGGHTSTRANGQDSGKCSPHLMSSISCCLPVSLISSLTSMASERPTPASMHALQVAACNLVEAAISDSIGRFTTHCHAWQQDGGP